MEKGGLVPARFTQDVGQTKRTSITSLPESALQKVAKAGFGFAPGSLTVEQG
jgi:hypothetical protein